MEVGETRVRAGTLHMYLCELPNCLHYNKKAVDVGAFGFRQQDQIKIRVF